MAKCAIGSSRPFWPSTGTIPTVSPRSWQPWQRRCGRWTCLSCPGIWTRWSICTLACRWVSSHALFSSITDAMARHRLKLPADFLLLIKSVTTIEAVGRQLDPTFKIVEHAASFVEFLIAQQHSPAALALRTTDAGRDMLSALRTLPARYRHQPAITNTPTGPTFERSRTASEMPSGVGRLLKNAQPEWKMELSVVPCPSQVAGFFSQPVKACATCGARHRPPAPVRARRQFPAAARAPASTSDTPRDR